MRETVYLGTGIIRDTVKILRGTIGLVKTMKTVRGLMVEVKNGSVVQVTRMTQVMEVGNGTGEPRMKSSVDSCAGVGRRTVQKAL